MYIAIDLTSLAGNFSGIEQYAFHISESLAKVGSSHRFVFIFKDEVFAGLKETVLLPNVEHITLHPRINNKLVASQRDLPRALARIHADAYLFPAFPQPLSFKHNNAVNVIHDVSFFDCPHTLTKKSLLYWRTASRHAVHNKLILTVSQFSKNRIASTLRVPIDSIEVIYNGISRDFLAGWDILAVDKRQALQKKYGLPSSFVLSLCTLEPRKNLALLVESWVDAKTIDDRVPDLVLAGRQGWMNDKLLSGVPAGLMPHVHLPGFIDAEDLPHLYHMCGCFVYPSLYEGFGLPPLEALAAGAPVLCSDIEVFHETCGNLVRFFSPNDSAELTKLLLEPTMSTSQATSRSVCDQFNWNDSATKLLSALQRLVV